MQIVVELDDPHYSEIKAIELIREAQTLLNNPGPMQNDALDYHGKIKQAISLLALARLQRNARAKTLDI